MLQIKKEIIGQILAAKQLPDLFKFLQKAIELEHATIPAYLTAMISLKFGKNNEAWHIIHSVVVEEMLHMTIAANILNAIGGTPDIDHKAFIPAYPCTLPLNIDNGLVVGLEKYSTLQLQVFMSIEEPEDPLTFPDTTMHRVNFVTIGSFYNAIKSKIRELAPELLPGKNEKQVVSSFFSPQVLFPVITKTDAARAIDVIIEQGEGTSKKPTDEDGELAHYYRFEELFKDKKLDRQSGHYIFSNPIPFNYAEVWPLTPNTKSKDFAAGTRERKMIDDFNAAYSRLLKALHLTFNGKPETLSASIGLMYDLKLAGQQLASVTNPNNPEQTIGPSFEYFST